MALLDLYRDSVDAFTRRVATIRPEQWHAATPCTEWDVRTLVNHIVYEQRWSAPLFQGATIAEVGERFEGDLLGDDPTGNAASAGKEAKDAVAGPDVLTRTVHLSFGDTPGEEYVRQLFADHLVHGWDLAVAIGADRRLNPDAVHEVMDWYADREDAYRGTGMIGPRVPLPPDASEQDRLLARFGRDPHWPS
ncbi:MAG TPA: TIGR03086 family metal-binding protein [Micromonosporaceae bacterium]